MPFNPFSSGGGAPINPNHGYDLLGVGTNGEGTSVAGNSSSNVKGNWVALGTASAAWSALELCIGKSSSGALRGLIDLSFDGGTTVHAPNIPFQNGTSTPWVEARLPLKVPNGADVRARIQGSVGSGSVGLSVRGHLAAAGSHPGFDQMVSLTAVTASSLADDADVLLGGAWVELVAATTEAYGALLASFSTSGVNPAVAQDAFGALGIGASGAEVALNVINLGLAAGQPSVRNGALLIEKATAAGVRLSARMKAATPGSDTFRVGLHGFK